MTALERAISALSPRWALRRAQAREMLALLTGYDAADPSRLRRHRRDNSSANRLTAGAGNTLRAQSRYLDRNHDIARGIFTTLVNNIVGAEGIQVEPQPRTRAGDIHEDLAKQLTRLHRDLARTPEITHELSEAQAQRLACRTWLRDGEYLVRSHVGRIPGYDHGSELPLSFEFLEPDFLPFELSDPTRNIAQGIERDAWGRRTGYHLLRAHPGDAQSYTSLRDLIRVPATDVLHPRWVDRFHQLRGVPALSAVITRLDDIKDYEESERVAAKVAASVAAMIIKGDPSQYQTRVTGTAEPAPRQLKFRPGMIFDDLKPGERIEMVDSNRPNPNVGRFRDDQLRAVAAGVPVSYSSSSRNYNGTWSSQRQELVEQWVHYAVIQSEFAAQDVAPRYELAVAVAVLSGRIQIPRDLDLATLDEALYIGPQMPWVNPLDEAEGWKTLERAGYATGTEIIRRRGRNPWHVLEEEARWRQKAADAGVVLDTDPAKTAAAGTAQDWRMQATNGSTA